MKISEILRKVDGAGYKQKKFTFLTGKEFYEVELLDAELKCGCALGSCAHYIFHNMLSDDQRKYVMRRLENMSIMYIRSIKDEIKIACGDDYPDMQMFRIAEEDDEMELFAAITQMNDTYGMSFERIASRLERVKL